MMTRSACLLFLLFALPLSFFSSPVHAVSLISDLHDFTAPPNPLDSQAGLIQGNDGNFYGTTYYGGTRNDGTVFKVTLSGTLTTLVDFDSANGSNPSAGLVQGDDGNFYGTTISGGSVDRGTIFRVTSSGILTTLHSFGDGSALNDGALPISTLLQGNDGSFYGTTQAGGSAGYGAVFKMTATGTVITLHSFSAVAGGDNVNIGGATPYAGLIQGTDGNLYGTTIEGGSFGGGTVYNISSSGLLTTLHNFSLPGSDGTSSDGSEPIANLIEGSDGNFYGMTPSGGANGVGTLFRLNVSNTQPITITDLAPNAAQVGGPAFTLTISGTNFTGSTTVIFGNTSVPITARSTTQLKVTVPASAITMIGSYPVVVSNPGSATLPFAVTYPWSALDVAAVPDGTARLLWGRSDGAAGIWVLSANDSQTLAGPVYGPYTGWVAQDLTAAPDGTSRILWNRYDGATGVWALDAHGNETGIGPTYGPFSGWRAIDLATAPNGTSRLMWRYTNGEAGLLSLNATGGQVISGRSYGPYTGWTATAVGAAGDGTARMLWTRSDGAMGLWYMDANDMQASVGPVYGPYSDSHGHWTATDLSTSDDGTSEVLWKRSDGAVGVWSFSASNVQTLVGPVYGPYAGWTAAALDAASDKSRVLWVRSDRVAGIWSFGANDIESVIGPVYGPY